MRWFTHIDSQINKLLSEARFTRYSSRSSFERVDYYSQAGKHKLDHHQRLHTPSKLLHRRIHSISGSSDDDDGHPHTARNRHSLQAVELSQRAQADVQIVSNLPAPSNGGAAIYRFWACRPCGPAGWLALLIAKASDVETNPGPTTLNKKVWICDIFHKQLHVRRQISIRCNRIEHWVHLRCVGIRQTPIHRYLDMPFTQ